MALVVGALQSSFVSGKVGEVVFSYNQHGQYVRDNVAFLDPNTAQQQAWRAVFTALALDWEQLLSQSERELWHQFGLANPMCGRHGKHKFTSGRNWFFRLNSYRVAKGLGVRVAPPVNPAQNYNPDLSIIVNGTGLQLVVDPIPSAEQLILVSSIPLQNVGRSFPPNLTTFLLWVDSGVTSPVTLIPIASFPVEEKRAFFKLITIDNFGRGNKPLWLNSTIQA